MDPIFLQKIALSLAEEKDFFQSKTEREYSHLCDASRLQEGFRFRARERSLRIAEALLDEQGELKGEALQEILHFLEKKPCLFYPEGYNDQALTTHFLAFLQKLAQDPKLFKSIRQISLPLCHSWAEQLVRDTLRLPKGTSLTDGLVRRAILAVCLHPLRQNVGSCFATAPAILIQQTQVELLIADLNQLLATGKLKRTFGGEEYIVPLSPSSGIGDFKRPLSSARPYLSPGFIASLLFMGLLDPGLDTEEKIQSVRTLLSSLKEDMSIEEAIRALLLKRFGVTSEEVELSQRPSSTFTVFLAHKKREACERLLEIEKGAKAAFHSTTENALLKAWEFTLASFSEAKKEFSRWNLYHSLGFNYAEPGGIGEAVYRRLEAMLEEANRNLEQYQREYLTAFDQVKMAESYLRRAATESEMRRLQAEYQSRLYHMQTYLDLRDGAQQTAVHCSSFYSFLLKQYDEKFPLYFQEIYDAEMQELKSGLYDDSPAGFRLVYKHGRTDPSLWTFVYSAEQYLSVLVDFFRSTERSIEEACEWEEGKVLISELTTLVITHVGTPVFFESALERMQRAHAAFGTSKKEEKKPWAYTSGGTMSHLLKTYYCREGEITEESRWVESPVDLLIFLVDTLKSLPERIAEKRMLMYSPTHAFILEPTRNLFKEGWEENLFTYTWVRDRIVEPRVRFYAAQQLSLREQEFILHAFSETLPALQSHILARLTPYLEDRSSIIEFRDKVERALPYQQLLDEFDHFLYQMLPLVGGGEWEEKVSLLLGEFFDAQILEKIQAPFKPFWGAKEVQDAAKACLLLQRSTVYSNFDIHAFIAERARRVDLAPPEPLVFADTNWTNFYFAFLINPGTGKLELWRTDLLGISGYPMSIWSGYLNGSERKNWGIYTKPYEYS